MPVRTPDFERAGDVYDKQFLERLVKSLLAWATRLNAPYPHTASTLNINIGTLPTEADVATLRSGDVYRDTTASNVLKIVP